MREGVAMIGLAGNGKDRSCFNEVVKGGSSKIVGENKRGRIKEKGTSRGGWGRRT